MNTYNSKLQTNNTTIQELIDLANSLPEAGSGYDFTNDIFKITGAKSGSFTPSNNSRYVNLPGFANTTPKIAIVYATSSATAASPNYPIGLQIFIMSETSNPYTSDVSFIQNGDGIAANMRVYYDTSGTISSGTSGAYNLVNTSSNYAKVRPLLNATTGYGFFNKSSLEDDEIVLYPLDISSSTTFKTVFAAGVTYNWVIFYE